MPGRRSPPLPELVLTYRGFNSVVESFWARMQTELLDTRRWRTRTELSTEIFDWIEVFYNRKRRHSSLGMLAPIAYEKLHANDTSAA